MYENDIINFYVKYCLYLCYIFETENLRVRVFQVTISEANIKQGKIS